MMKGLMIKGAKMPETCFDCPCCQDLEDFDPHCGVTEREIECDGVRPKDCPLIEIGG